jgi:hypothetical protein
MVTAAEIMLRGRANALLRIRNSVIHKSNLGWGAFVVTTVTRCSSATEKLNQAHLVRKVLVVALF